MKVIVGLGNPGVKYKNTRHNIGKEFVDFCIKKCDIEKEKKFKDNVTFVRFKKEKDEVFFVKTLVYMNFSGGAVLNFVSFFKIPLTSLFVVHDDLDIPLGKFRIDFGKGPRLHNGIRSIEMALKTKDFWRVRIGVDNREKTGWVEGKEYVLQKFFEEEKEVVKEVFEKIFERLKL